MEVVGMDTWPPEQHPDDEFRSAVLHQFRKTSNDHHLHVCDVIGAMSRELVDQTLPLTPIGYFGATCSSLDRLCSIIAGPPTGHHLDALLTILSLVIGRFSPALLGQKYDYLSELLIRILGVESVGVHGVVPGIKCVSRLLVAGEKAEWAELAPLYGVLICYVTDDRLEVRKQCHSCLREVLEAPTLAPLLEPASEAITNVFERCIRIAGGSYPTVSEGPKAAQEVLYILDALKLCLPYMSSTSSTNILKHFKYLLGVTPIVTRRIVDGLNSLCLRSVGEISADALLELLCSLTNSDESSADSMTFTARLLDTGMKRVYSINRQICVDKLPVVFNALKGILASDHEEASIAAVAAFKSLIHSCIDESLIKQGVDQVTANANETTRKTGPTVIEKVCATIESLFDYQYELVWDMSFQIASTLFDKLGKYSSYFLKETLKSLADMQKFPDEDFALRKQLHECIGTAVGAMGPDTFLSHLPLNLGAEDLSESNLWLFPILKQYTVGAHLNFFTKSILPMIGEMKQKSSVLEREGKIQSARTVDGIFYSLWSLLPSFCNYPLDTAESFKGLEKALYTALQEDPEVRGLICSGLQILIQQNKRALEGKQNNPNIEIGTVEERAVALYTAHVAASNLSTLKSSAGELLTVLTGIFSISSKDTGGILQSTIGELASISDREVVTRFFTKTMQKLLKVTQEAGKSENSKDSNSMEVDNLSNEGSFSTARGQLFDFAVSLLPGLDSKEIDFLFDALKPALKDVDGVIQKKAYRALYLILQDTGDFVSRKLEEVLSLMIKVWPSCHFSAKHHRLNCLYSLILHAAKEGSEKWRQDITASFLTEIILALKEANNKTRNTAYDILVQIGHACGNEETCGKEKLRQYFNMVAGGLAGETPHMISAAMTGLARLTYEFQDLISSAYNVLPSAFLLLQRKNKEIIKASLGFLKVLVAKSQAEGLQAHLPSMVEGLLNWPAGTKNHFKAKVKMLLEMLVKKCGLDAVKKLMPEEHMKLLTNIRKLNNRKEKKNAAKFVDERSVLSKATTSRMSQWNYTNIFSEFDETVNSDGESTDGKSISCRQSKYSAALQSKATLLRSKKSLKVAKSLREDSFDQLDDEPLDLLDGQKTRSALQSSRTLKWKHGESDDEQPFIDSEGRLIINEEGKIRRSDGKKKRDQPLETEEVDGISESGSHLSAHSRKTQLKRRKISLECGRWAYTGKEYASKKAGGDLKRKDKVEPYAYWPLDRKMMSRRPEHRAAARNGMASVVKLTKRKEQNESSSKENKHNKHK